MQKIVFIADAEPHELGPDDPRYKAGESHEMRTDKAQRWIRRGKAEAVQSDPEPPPRARRRRSDAPAIVERVAELPVPAADVDPPPPSDVVEPATVPAADPVDP